MEDMPLDPDEQDPIEIIDVPGERRLFRPAFFGKKAKKCTSFLMLISTLLLALVLLNAASGSRLLNYVGSLWPHSVQPTPIVSYTVGIQFQSSLIKQLGSVEVYTIHNRPPAPAPNNCPQTDQVDSKQTIGAPPLWISGFTGPHATAHLKMLSTLQVQGDPSDKLSLWGIHLRIVLQSNFRLPVNLSFVSIDGLKTPTVGFQRDEQQPVTKNKDLYNLALVVSDSVTIDPHNPTQVPDGIDYKGGNTWEILVYLFEAGCYGLNADWGSGQWQAHFAAGR